MNGEDRGAMGDGDGGGGDDGDDDAIEFKEALLLDLVLLVVLEVLIPMDDIIALVPLPLHDASSRAAPIG